MEVGETSFEYLKVVELMKQAKKICNLELCLSQNSIKTTLLKLSTIGLSLHDGMRKLLFNRDGMRWNKETRKFHTMIHGSFIPCTLHPKSNMSRIYLLQDMEGRGLIGLKDYFGGK